MRRRRSKAPLVFTVLILLAAAAGFWIWKTRSNPPARSGGGRGSRAVPVATTTARQADLPIYLSALGSVSAWNTTTVRSRVDGQLMKLHFTEGQEVKAGDLIAEIDPAAYRAALAQAEGQLARDQALLQNAKLDLERYLSAQDAVATQQVDTAKATVAQYEGVVRADQGVVDNDRLELGYCRILAPISGRAGLRTVDEGNLIHASDATGIVVITQDRPIAVFFSLPEDNLAQVQRAMAGGEPLKVEAFDRAMNQVLAHGKVIVLDNQIDAATGTVRLKAQFENENRTLFPNQFVNVRLQVEVLHDTVLVPLSAVQINASARYVFVVREDGTAEQRTVKIAATEADTVALAEGVKAGETIVTEGLDKLQNGLAVTRATPPAAGGDAANPNARRAKGPGESKGKGEHGNRSGQPKAP